MPLPTSDLHAPYCPNMGTLKNQQMSYIIGDDLTMDAPIRPNVITLPLETPLRQNAQILQGPNMSADLASVDSSDTYASCQTHPCMSQGDLTADLAQEGLDKCYDSNNLYINPLAKSNGNDSLRSQVKKSASGDVGMRQLATDERYKNFQPYENLERGSRVSLNETPVPKHRKARFQHQQHQISGQSTGGSGGGNTAKQKPRFDEISRASEDNILETKKSTSRKSTFNPGKSFASATKIINHHLFGNKHDNKLSLSADSIDSSPNLETHRRSKSILKNKTESHKSTVDPESERLLSDNLSGNGVFDGATGLAGDISDTSTIEYSPNRKKFASTMQQQQSLVNPTHRNLIQQRSVPSSSGSKLAKFQMPRYTEDSGTRTGKIPLFRTNNKSMVTDHLISDTEETETPFNSTETDRDDGSDEHRKLIQRQNSFDKSKPGDST